MKVELSFNKDFIKELHLAFYEALDRSFVQDIINNTPVDTGVTRNRWDFYPTDLFEYKLENSNGLVVLYLEKGTGIYGPRRTYIVPKRKKYLRWWDRKRKRWVFAKKVRGIKPHKFIDASLHNLNNYGKFTEVLKNRLGKIKAKWKH